MALTFSRKKGSRNSSPFSSDKELLMKKVLGKSTRLQKQRMLDELIKGGFIKSEDDLTEEVLNEYKTFKLFMPRIAYNNHTRVQVDLILSAYNDLDPITAEEIYNILNNISEVCDATIYYWFSRMDIKFSSKGTYTKGACRFIVYMALCRKARLEEKDLKEQNQ